MFGFVAGCLMGNVILAFLAAAYWIAMAIPISAAFAMPTPQRRALVGAAAVVIALLPAVGVIRSLMHQSAIPLYVSFQWFAYSLLAIQIASTAIAVKPVRD